MILQHWHLFSGLICLYKDKAAHAIYARAYKLKTFRRKFICYICHLPTRLISSCAGCCVYMRDEQNAERCRSYSLSLLNHYYKKKDPIYSNLTGLQLHRQTACSKCNICASLLCVCVCEQALCKLVASSSQLLKPEKKVFFCEES